MVLFTFFRSPHVPMRVPAKYFELYRNKKHIWDRDRETLIFPKSASKMGHKCCAEKHFEYLNNNGKEKSNNRISLHGNVNFEVPQSMFTELMWGYAAAVSFMDAQLGRLLDVIDELNMWNNLTVVLTSDHGMHNGEKGLWYV